MTGHSLLGRVTVYAYIETVQCKMRWWKMANNDPGSIQLHSIFNSWGLQAFLPRKASGCVIIVIEVERQAFTTSSILSLLKILFIIYTAVKLLLLLTYTCSAFTLHSLILIYFRARYTHCFCIHMRLVLYYIVFIYTYYEQMATAAHSNWFVTSILWCCNVWY